jgi:hypothetical protein
VKHNMSIKPISTQGLVACLGIDSGVRDFRWEAGAVHYVEGVQLDRA